MGRTAIFVRVIHFTGFTLLGLGTLIAIIAIWFFLTPPSTSEDFAGKLSPASAILFVSTSTIAFLIFLSIVLSRNRVRLLAVFSLCLALILCVAWFRSFGSIHTWEISKAKVLSDHIEISRYCIRTGDGGLCFIYIDQEDWDNLETEETQSRREHPWQTQILLSMQRNQKSQYPMHNDAWKVWGDGWLDSIGIRFWAKDLGKRGTDWFFSHRAMVFPSWVILILCLIFPSIYSVQIFRRWRRTRDGLCKKCGYDLRGSADKCPECATPIPPRKEIAKAPDAAKPTV